MRLQPTGVRELVMAFYRVVINFKRLVWTQVKTPNEVIRNRPTSCQHNSLGEGGHAETLKTNNHMANPYYTICDESISYTLGWK
jgi:hypothetical protein